MEQALYFASCAENATAVEVPVREAGVHDLNEIKTVELMDPISPSKLTSTTDDQLPPLLSMIIDGLPPLQQSNYVNEAEKCLHQYVECYPNVSSLGPYYRIGLSFGSYVHPKVINVDRLVVISINYALLWLIDDLFFDTPDDHKFLQNQYGISGSACGSPQQIQEYLDHLATVFKQEKEPSNPAPLIETMMWEIGRDTLKLSNLEWFNHYVESVMECWLASADSQADIAQGHNLCVKDLESYTAMRIGNGGGRLIQMLVEIASDAYIPSVLRKTPYMENLTTTTSIHLGIVNDFFSYHKESQLEQNPRNLITVLMECQGKPFAETVHVAINLTNAYAHAILDLEDEAWNPTLQNYLQDIKAVIAGNVYFSSMDYRYRHPESLFPELRDTSSSWKILPYALA